MRGIRIDFRAAIDGLLLAVPFVLLCTVIPSHVIGIGVAWSIHHYRSGSSALGPGELFFFTLWLMSLIGAFATMGLFAPPLRATPARLRLILLVTLLAIALAVIDMIYNG
jgi:hypothetical protein